MAAPAIPVNDGPFLVRACPIRPWSQARGKPDRGPVGWKRYIRSEPRFSTFLRFSASYSGLSYSGLALDWRRTGALAHDRAQLTHESPDAPDDLTT